MCCLACDQPVAGKPRNYGIVVPDVADPQIVVDTAVCATCGPDPDGIPAALLPTLRIIWPSGHLFIIYEVSNLIMTI